jgi:hypothetical protein
MANAGYNPAAAPRFFAGWGQLHGGGITRSPTHDGWQDRVAAVTAELPAITAAQASSGEKLADWRTRFPGQLAE